MFIVYTVVGTGCLLFSVKHLSFTALTVIICIWKCVCQKETDILLCQEFTQFTVYCLADMLHTLLKFHFIFKVNLTSIGIYSSCIWIRVITVLLSLLILMQNVSLKRSPLIPRNWQLFMHLGAGNISKWAQNILMRHHFSEDKYTSKYQSDSRPNKLYHPSSFFKEHFK